jgi:hypothetical protein
MPDWIVHVLVPWSIITVLGFRYKIFSQQYAAVAMLGALIPDIFKVYIPLEIFGINAVGLLTPIHLPIGSFLIAGIVSLFFLQRRIIFIFLIFGVITHYLLDLLLFDGGMELFYPFSPLYFQIGIISDVDFNIDILTIIIVAVVFFIYYFQKLRKGKVKV